MKYEKSYGYLFNEQMTSNEARTVFFEALEGKTQEEVEQIKADYFKILPIILEKEMRLAEDGWMID